MICHKDNRNPEEAKEHEYRAEPIPSGMRQPKEDGNCIMVKHSAGVVRGGV